MGFHGAKQWDLMRFHGEKSSFYGIEIAKLLYFTRSFVSFIYEKKITVITNPIVITTRV
jgi:hypothetical protein